MDQIRLTVTLVGIGIPMEMLMGKMKELVYDIIEALEVNEPQVVADQFGLTVPQVLQVSRDYGSAEDIDDTNSP
jgi:hypothetical protein